MLMNRDARTYHPGEPTCGQQFLSSDYPWGLVMGVKLFKKLFKVKYSSIEM